jgi:nicotinamide mononucleotide transporter
VSPLELLAAGLGIVNIVLIARRTALNYPFGIAMVMLYAAVFWQTRLYGTSLLQGFFLAAQLYGWWYWRRSRSDLGPVPVRRLTGEGLLIAAMAGVAGSALAGVILSSYTDAAAPWWDGLNAGWSIVAQLLTDRRFVESWPLWIAIDVLSVWLYASQGLLATAALYAVFLCLAAWGWSNWRRAAA